MHQKRWAEEAAAAHGWRLARVIEGVATGKAGPRRLVRELLADIRALESEARPKKLMMIRADRLGRGSIVETQIVLRDLLQLGVGVFTRDQGEVKLDSAMDELISAATLAVARHENDVRSDKAREVRRRKRAANEPMGVAPYGLHVRDKKYVVDPDRAAIVRNAFELRVQGNGYHAIARQLIPIAPPHQFQKKSRPVHWTTTRVRKMLSNRAYIGVIVDEATFARAQKVAAQLTNQRLRPEARKYPWPLAGSVRCGTPLDDGKICARTLIGIACGAEPWRYRYYGCRARWNHGGKFRLVRADSLEDEFVGLLARLRASKRLVTRYSTRAAAPVSPRLLERSIRDLKKERAEIDRRRDAVWELHAAGKVRAEDVQERLDALGSHRDELDHRLASAQEQLAIANTASKRVKDVEALIARAAKTFLRANVGEQNQIARAISLELGGLAADSGGKITVLRSTELRP